jgi:hypothetical protein
LETSVAAFIAAAKLDLDGSGFFRGQCLEADLPTAGVTLRGMAASRPVA